MQPVLQREQPKGSHAHCSSCTSRGMDLASSHLKRNLGSIGQDQPLSSPWIRELTQQGRQQGQAQPSWRRALCQNKTSYKHETRGSTVGVSTSHSMPAHHRCPASTHIMGCASQGSIALQNRTSSLAPVQGKHDRARRAPAAMVMHSGWLLPALF